MDKKMFSSIAKTPFGPAFVTLQEGVLLELKFVKDKIVNCNCQVQSIVDRVFQGDDVPYKLVGTEFQRAVWGELLKIPLGRTSTYQEIASAVGKPNGARAVGNAVGANPLHYIVPCHRVIRKNGEMGGFAGGIDVKKNILKQEGIELQPPL
jgi:O-6-methylguanine DNA methyltransferase